MTVPAAPYPKPFSGTIGSLSPGTPYYYKAYAENTIGETIADTEVSFTTWDIPTLQATPTKDNIQATSATLGGTVTFDGGTTVTQCGVTWGTTSGAGPYANSAPAGDCTTDSPFTINTNTVGSLTTGTTYYFRSYATNAVGTAYSAEEGSFVPSGPPQLSATVDPDSVTDTQALLGGNITDNGGSAITAVGIYWDTIGTDPRTDGTHVPMTVADPLFNQIVNDLTPGSTIYFIAYATNGAGTTDSTIASFDTDAGAPIMDPTPTVENIAGDGADLGGTISADGGGANLDCGVEWTTVSGEPYESSQSFETGPDNGTCVENVAFAVSVSGLISGQTYYFRAWATSDAGSDVSSELPFVPQAKPIVTSAEALNPTHNSAVLGGEVTSDEGSPVTARGIVWDTISISADPTSQPTATFVPMGSGTGTFSQVVGSLPSGETIYFEAYATNSAGTGYSSQGLSVDTGTKPTAQATGLVLTPYGRSVRVSWTRGNGDGSLVSIRLSGVTEVPPTPFTDYAADPKYDNTPPPPQTTGGSNNFVVYKGSNNTILVHGLELETTYEVAVYEYAGLGANSDYLTPSLTLPVTTGNTPVHNKDYAVDCEQCHKHGSYRPRQDELETKCKTCHDIDGVAKARLEFKNHVLPNRNADIDFVDCGMCHELHNGALTYTRGISWFGDGEGLNKSFLRTNVTKYVPNAVEPAILRDANDQPKREDGNASGYAPAAANTPNRAVEGGTDATARGYCQVCHTQTAYHRNAPGAGGADTLADHGKTGLMQCHDGGDQNVACAEEVHCGDCHEHNNSFQGVNNNLPCEQCHDQPQPTGAPTRRVITTEFDLANSASSHIPNGTPVKADCVVCHGNHGHGGTVPGLDADTGELIAGTSTIPTTATGAGEVFEPHCMSCHEDASADFQATAGDADRTPSSPFIGATQFPTINESLWGDPAVDPVNAAAHNRPTSVVGSTGPVSCVGNGANGCHGSGHGTTELKLLHDIPVDGEITNKRSSLCTNCHQFGGTSSLDIRAQFNPLTGTDFQTDAASGHLANQRHDIFDADLTYSSTGAATSTSLACADCHSVHVDNDVAPVQNPDTGLPLQGYNPATWATQADIDANDVGEDPTFGAGELDMIEFCLACHDNTPAGSAQFPDNGIYDIATIYQSDIHGAGAGGTGGNGFLKAPFLVDTKYAPMQCTQCHGAHGSDNIFNLRSSITVGAGTASETVMSTGGFGGKGDIGSIITETYTLTNAGGGTQSNYQWGAWCSFCHNMEAHGVDETKSCNTGHRHGGGKL
jgi:hypothetical protein